MHKKTTLDNGLRVLTKSLPHTKSVTVLVLVGAGSRYETKEISGIAHFLEHMFFKGGERYKNTREVSEAIDSVGGAFNAFTGKEYVGYYVKLGQEKMDLAIDVLSDMLINAKLDPKEIDKERGVILEEYNMYQDTPMYQIGWDFETLIFGDQPMGRDQIGTKELIKNVTQDDFKKYRKELYTPDNVVISVVGNVDHDEVCEKISKMFAFENGKKAYDFDSVQDLDSEKNVSVQEKKTEQAHLVLGFPSVSEEDERTWMNRLLAVILGGNMSSRMFLNVREAKGLSYYISTSTDNYMDCGIISTRTGVDVSRVEEAIEAIKEQYELAGRDGLTEEELKKAKEYFKGKMVLNLEDTEEFAHLIGKWELLHGGALGSSEIIDLIDGVELKELNEFASEILDMSKMKMAVIGPYEEGELKF